MLRLDAKESSTSHDERERNVRKRDVNEEKKKTRTKPALLWDLDENLFFFSFFEKATEHSVECKDRESEHTDMRMGDETS